MNLTLSTLGMQRLFFRGPSMTESVEQTDGLMIFLWWYAVFWFVLLMGLMFYFVVRYRRRAGRPAEPSPSHNLALETFWTVVPSLTLIVIFLFGFWGYMDKVTPAGDAVELNVKAWKWGWGITYPNGAQSPEVTQIDEGGRQVPVFVIPEDTDIRLRMSSQDVIHSFWIPDLRVKMDVMPNRYTGYGFRTPALESGETARDLWIFCAEYCGDDHSEMAAIFRVVPRHAYGQTIQEWATPGDLLVLGEAQYRIRCASCHTIDGSPLTGPTWLGGANYQGQQYGYGYPVRFTDGTSLDARDADYLRESILNPGAKVVDGYPATMTSFDGVINDTQLEALILYYQSLSDRGPQAEAQGELSADPPADPPADPLSDAPAPSDAHETDPPSDPTEQTGGQP